jgi:hypothetical protein
VTKRPRPGPSRRKPARHTRASPSSSKNTIAAICYFCGYQIGADDRIRQFHELMVHASCYQRDASR